MRFVIIGPGALGCLFAATLASDPRHQVWMLDHDRQRADLLTRQGILLTDADNREHRCSIRAAADAETIPDADCILLCVKSQQVPSALDAAGPLIQAAPLTVTLQNGITHLETIGARLPPHAWAAGVTAQGATLLGPGRVRHGGGGRTQLGFTQPAPAPAAAQLQRVALALTQAGIATEVAADIRQHVWRKLLINVGINALTAIHDCANGGLLSSPAALQRMRRAVTEGAAVAAGLGIVLTEDPVALAMEVCAATAANISSMLQDVRNRRPTEIDAINGAVVKAGHRLRLAVPENEALTRQIKTLESTFADDYP